MNLDNIPPALLQQLMNQLGGLDAQADLVEDEEDEITEEKQVTPLSQDPIDIKLAQYLTVDDTLLEEGQVVDRDTGYFEMYLQSAFKEQATTMAEAYAFLDKKYANHSVSNGICGKKMTFHDVGYSCLDCQMDPTCIVCKECFENANHKGHRFQIKPNVSGMCDCGDPEAWKEQGNCTKHGGFLEEDDRLEPEIKLNLITEFKRFVYYIVQALELNSTNKTVRNHISKQFFDLIKGVMKLNQNYVTIACQFGKAFCQTYESSFEDVKLWHRCTCAVSEETPSSMLGCGCTVLRSLLRVNILLSLKTQNLINEFFMFMFVDYNFKDHLAIEFVRMVNFQINWDKIGHKEDDKNSVSKLLGISIQIMTSEQLALDAIEQAGIYNMLEGLQKLVGKYVKDNGYLEFDDQFINTIWMNVHYTLMKRSAIKKVFEDRASLKMLFLFFEEVIKHAPKFVYIRHGADLSVENNVVQAMYFELTMLRHFTEFLSSLWSKDVDSAHEGYFNFFREAKESIYRISAHAEENKSYKVNKINSNDDGAMEEEVQEHDYASETLMTVQRLFIQGMIPYFFIQQNGDNLEVVEFSKEKMNKFNTEVFNDEQDCKRFWVKMTDCFSGAVGFQREFCRDVWGFYGPIKERFRWLYYNFKIHNLDLVGLQMCAINLPQKFTSFMWNNYFSCDGKEELTKFEIGQAMDKYNPEKEDNRIQGISKSLGDFFSYQVEISTNQHNILWVLEQYIEYIGRNYDSLKFTNTLAGKMADAKNDILFSMMSAVPPTEVTEFIKFINQHLEDKEILNSFLKNKATLNREKRTVTVKRDLYMKAINKVYKNVKAFSEKKADKAKLSIPGAPYSSVFWYDPNKKAEAFSEINERQTIAARDFVNTNKVEGQLKELIEVPQIYFYPFRHTKFIKSVNFDPSEFILNFLQTVKIEDMSLIKGDLPQLYRSILISIDLGHTSPEFVSQIESFIKNLPDGLKSDPQFKLFSQIFNVLASVEGDIDENAELKEEQKKKRLAKKKKMLAKRKRKLHSKMKNKMSSFLEKLEDNVEEMVQEMVGEDEIANQGEVVSCVVSNQEIQNDQFYYQLAHVKFSNVSFFLRKFNF